MEGNYNGKRAVLFKILRLVVGHNQELPKCKDKLIIAGNRGWKLYKCTNPECDFGKKPLRYPWEIWK